MARIRSIHPGLFTDESFMSASANARLLVIGIWTEAWDDGVFEWKPLTLKAKLFPVDNVDLPALLEELVTLRFVQRFTVAGKDYGAIRNFRKFQRPKKPNSSGVLPPSLVPYVGSSEPVPNQFGSGGEKPPQMEDGGKDEGVGEDPPSGSNEPSGGRARAPASFLPTGWKVSQTQISYASSQGIPEKQIQREAEKFRAHHKANGTERADWNAAWERWVIEACERAGYSPPCDKPAIPLVWVTIDDGRWKAAAAAYKRSRGKDPPTYSGTNGQGFHFAPEHVGH